MANEVVPTNEYPLPKDSYAAFDAISLRNLMVFFTIINAPFELDS